MPATGFDFDFVRMTFWKHDSRSQDDDDDDDYIDDFMVISKHTNTQTHRAERESVCVCVREDVSVVYERSR